MARRYSRASQCTGKLRWYTRKEARAARQRTGRKGLHIYRCPWCNALHIGGRPDQVPLDEVRDDGMRWHEPSG